MANSPHFLGYSHAGLQARRVAVRRRCPRLEQGETIGERDEQCVARLYGYAGDDVARVAEARHDSVVREHGMGERALAHASGAQYCDARRGGRQ
jgi:hypothetical protein